MLQAEERWELDLAASRGEYGVRHAVLGHRVFELVLCGGELLTTTDGPARVRIEAELGQEGGVRVVFEGEAGACYNVNWFPLQGEVWIRERCGRAGFALHDLGPSPDGRRFTAISGVLDRSLAPCSPFHRSHNWLARATASFFVDAVWRPRQPVSERAA